MSEVIVPEVTEVAIEPVIETVVEPTPEPEVPEKIYSFQPTDDSGRPLGGKQVIKYRTQEELAEKLVDQNIHLVRKLREQTTKNRLGIQDTEVIPESAPKFDVPLDFNPRDLTPEERVQLSRDLLDPERFQEASDALFEASLGAKPTVLRSAFSDLSRKTQGLLAKVESDSFMAANPDYYPCPDNFNAITGWMVKNNLAPVRQNFQLAFDTLKQLQGGVIVGKPEEIRAVDIVVVPEPTPTIVEHVVPVVEPQVPEAVQQVSSAVPPATGLRDGGTAVVLPKKFAYTLAEINRMPADVYKKKFLGEKGFPELVEALERDARERRN